MSEILSSISRHGYLVVFGIVLAEAVGLPMPAALALLAAGAAVGAHTLYAPAVWLVAIAGTLLGDTFLFVMGGKMGWRLLGYLCRVSMNPETCILRSAESFYKRGKTTLIFAKFVPGVNTMAPPLAGSMKMPLVQFLRFDVLGGLLYTSTYLLLGLLGRDFLRSITHGVQTAGHAVGEVVLAGIAAYFVYRLWLYRKHRMDRFVPRVQVEELIRRLRAEEGERILVADVRSHGYYDAEAARIKGSIRIEPNDLEAELRNLPRDKDIYLYCT
jgi:membrane protein DedA with SNARE-associated domain